MRRWVITTGKGDVFVTLADSQNKALVDFQRKFLGHHVASIVEATEF